MTFKDSPIVFMTRTVWRFSKTRKRVALYFALFVISDIILLLEPLLVAVLLNTVQAGVTAANINSILMIVGLFIALELGFWAFHGTARVIENNNAFRVRASYKRHMFDGTMSLPMRWHTEHHSGDTIDKIEKGSYGIFEYSGHTFQVIRIIVTLVSAYFILAFFNIHSVYIVAAMMALMFLTILRIDKTLVRNWSRLNIAENAIAAKVYDTISNITTVVTLRMEKFSSLSIARKIAAPYGLYRRTNWINELKWCIISLIGIAMLVMVLASYILENFAAGTPILIGTLYALYGYVENIRHQLFEFAWFYSDIVRWKTSIGNAQKISGEFRGHAAVKTVDLNKPWAKLNVDKLSFNYHDADEELHLNDVSLEIRRGEKIALVGESGSGKTTFLKLLRALYSPKRAAVSVDGRALAGFESISPNITLVPQDPELFDATVRENITAGRSYTMAKIRKYTDMARFTAVAQRLPRKFNSHIKERGVNLSTGEKQRLALSRGLLAADNTPILLLDEPTSSVDSANERAIYENVFRAFGKKTIISSVHRLHLLPMFDMIYVFKSGKIVARGTLGRLLKNREFSRMWKKYGQTQPVDL